MKKQLQLPLCEEEVRDLAVGDNVLLSGILYTGRDAAHKFLVSSPEKCPVDLKDSAIYHCGPIVIKKDGEWIITAAGPTTSSRTEPYVADIIRDFGVRAFIGKGGLGEKTLAACQEYGCVYLSAVGGCAQVLAKAIVKVRNVYFYEEFGPPEAIWELEVKDFPAIVTMDSHGKTLHKG
jgi:tartrate/fumarate subfamily iron-sulfur-dependent hydro-lyase beta chain